MSPHAFLVIGVLFLVLTMTLSTENDVADNAFGHTLSREKKALGRETGIQFLGIGYHIFKASPDGGLAFEGTTKQSRDPGLQMEKKIIKWTQKYQNEESGAVVPDQVVFGGFRDTCVISKTYSMLYGAKSYQEELSRTIEVGVEVNFWIFSARFSMSHNVKTAEYEMNTRKNVFFRRVTFCNHGSIRYREAMAEEQQHELHKDFIDHVCRLPEKVAQTDRVVLAAYASFIDAWGTHMTTKLEFGSKHIQLYKEKLTTLVRETSREETTGVSVSGGIGPITLKASVDVSKLQGYARSHQEKFNAKSSQIIMGTKDNPEPVRLKLLAISELIDERFWKAKNSRCSNGRLPNLKRLKENLKYALSEYPKFNNLSPLKDLPTNFEVTWPAGTYEMLPYGVNRCPFSKSVIAWMHGRYIGSLTTCKKNMKSERSEIRFDWAIGEYCILRATPWPCPTGFSTGSMKLAQVIMVNGRRDDTYFNMYVNSGYLYLRSNRYNMDFCCRHDGYTSNPLLLPTNKPLVLIPTRNVCQAVTNMKATLVDLDDKLITGIDDYQNQMIAVKKSNIVTSKPDDAKPYTRHFIWKANDGRTAYVKGLRRFQMCVYHQDKPE